MTIQHQRDILKEPVDGKCRLCVTKDETTQHIISGCEKLAGTYYVRRHNNLVQYVYWCLAKKHNIEVSNLWWKETLVQPQVKENETAKIMWEMPVQTDVNVTHNRPDLIYINKITNETYLIDITVPSDYNIGPKEIEKLSKYHLLKTEISRLWNTQTTVIPIVIGVTGIVAKSIKKYIDQLDASIDIHILQKQAAIHSSTILSKVLGDTVFVRATEEQHSHTDTHTKDILETQNTLPSPSTEAEPAIQEQNTQQFTI
uniref:Reverse transcriptase zinc-binding domain-containing protein n=1 Tax=Heliothis virescens TaxID=7102 RepID=A0A2A4JIH0_HELVI